MVERKNSSLSANSTGNNIPTFVKPARVRNISNLSFDNGGHPGTGNEIANSRDVDNSHKSNSSVTYGTQTLLPALPVPTLKETLAKFLKHLEALEPEPEERRATEKAVREFLEQAKHDKFVSGPELQELLLEYDRIGRETGATGSYVEEFWSNAYLVPDASVVMNLNPYFLLEESPDPKLAGNQIRRAASLCFASVKMASQLRNETLKPDTFRGRALCMDQFRALFGASRVPKCQARDDIAIYEKTNHVAVMCRNQLFYFQALWPNGDVAVDEEDIVHILEAIEYHVRKLERTGYDENEQKYRSSLSALGVLTSLGRKHWARAREAMLKYSPTKNTESFEIVDSALFVLVLDDCIPSDKNQAAANMLHGSYELSEFKSKGDARAIEYQSGSCTNRWYDKLQIIVTADGGAGINFEHSAIDGHTALRFVSDIYADNVMSFAQSITKLVGAHEGLVPSVITANIRRAAVTLDNQGRPALDVFPKKINFDLSDEIRRKIYFAETALGDQILASDTHILEFKGYGKHFITFNKLSPDSFVQMSMMLAYYRLYGKVVCAYEPVLTKGFYHGRTEAMRPATMEAKNLCEVFCNPTSSSREKLGALRNATIAHSKLVKECAQGKGVDRHLFALKCIAEKNGLPIPEFFRSEAWRKLNHTILSTSNCGNPSLALFGFGPVVPDGYGIGYIIKKSQIHYAICSKHRQTMRYALTLEGVLQEMASLLEPISNTKVYDHNSPSLRTKLPTMMTVNDCYADVWGENSFQSTVDSGRPEVIDETTERRWSAEAITYDDELDNSAVITPSEDVGISEEPNKEEFLSAPIEAPLNDEAVDTDNDDSITNFVNTRRKSAPTIKRRGSNDMMPIRPDRRSSVNSIAVSKGDFAELMRLDELNKRDNSGGSGKNDTRIESPGKDGSKKMSLEAYLSSPVQAPLNDVVDNTSTTPGTAAKAAIAAATMTGLMNNRRKAAPKAERRGSNDCMPIRPDRRSSANSVAIAKKDLAELMRLGNFSGLEMFDENE